MPYIYFSILLVFLFAYSSFMTWQLFNFIRVEIFLNRIFSEELVYSTSEEFSALLRILFITKQWFRALILLEAQKFLLIKEEYYYLNIFGVIYQNMQDYDLAQLYYLKSLDKKPGYSVAIKNLSRLKS